MVQPNWRVFVAAALVATVGLLVLSRASARALRADPSTADEPGSADELGPPDEQTAAALPTGVALLANVGLTHGLLGAVLLSLVWWAGVPVATLGISPIGESDLAAGLGLGVGLYLATEAATVLAGRVGLAPDERLRALLAPTRPLEWAVLLLVVLPLIAGTEELLFRGILVGGVAAGLGVSPWLLVVASSVLFGLGHSAQGGLGVVVTVAIGVVLGAAFVATGSLLAVVLAHYTVDVLEFVIHEGVFD